MASNPRTLLTPAALHILMALADGDLHGYGVRRFVQERTGGALKLGPGTLYEALHRMLDDGWIRTVESSSDGRRKVYGITDAGRAEMARELARLDEIITYARVQKLLPRPGGES